MRRNPVRSVSLLLIILLLALGTTSAPVSAGAMTGNAFSFLLGQPVGTCAYGVTSLGHYFVATVSSAPTAPANPNNHKFSFANVLVNGPFPNLPDDLDGCTPLGAI